MLTSTVKKFIRPDNQIHHRVVFDRSKFGHKVSIQEPQKPILGPKKSY